ncbi:MAG: hypothetical protein ACRDP2_03295, partial [Nocardioidaceae bacterium]
MRGASSEASREIMRVRSFRNVLVVAALILAVIAVALGWIAHRSPEHLPMCFTVTTSGTAVENGASQASQVPVQVGASQVPAQNGADEPGEKVVCPTKETDILQGDDEDEVRLETIEPWEV